MKKYKHAIIFIPGFKGSTLVEQTGAMIWPNFIKAQINHTLSLSNDLPDIDLENSTRYESNNIVKSVTVLPGLFKRDIYKKFIETIQKQFQTRAELIFFHYDWRQDLMITVEKLKTLIEHLTTNGDVQIDIICHSMGGIITSRLMQIINTNAIRQLFFVAVPFRGTLKSLLDLMYGSQFGLNKTLLSAKAMASFSSLYYLLPRYPEAALDNNLFDINTWKKYNLGYLANQNNTSQEEFLKIQLDKVTSFYTKLESMENRSCENTKLIFINNTNNSTPTKIQFEPETKIIFNKGDGTVPNISLQIPDYYKQFNYETYHIDQPHALSFTSDELISYILKHLNLRTDFF